MKGFGDTLWIGPVLQRNIGNSYDWFWPENIDSIRSGFARVYSLSLSSDTIVAGLGGTKVVQNANTDFGAGFYTSVDGGDTWVYSPFPLQSVDDTIYLYGDNKITQLPITVTEESPPYSIAHRGESIFAAAWASGILRSSDFGLTWERLILPATYIDTLRPDRSYNFIFHPKEDFNQMGFAVHIDRNGWVWMGSANGINISPNALTAPKNEIIWYHHSMSAPVRSSSLLGNWVVEIEEDKNGTIWMTNWPASNGEIYGIVTTSDSGKTFQHHLAGQKIYDIDFYGDDIVAAGDNGLFVYQNNQWNQIRQIANENTFIKRSANFYSVAVTTEGLYVGSADGLAFTTDYTNWQIFRVNLPLTGINQLQEDVPQVKSYAYPNPFSPTKHEYVRIRFDLPSPANSVTVTMFDFAMNKIRTLESRQLSAGAYEAVWDGLNENGILIANQVVFYVIEYSEKRIVNKLLLLE